MSTNCGQRRLMPSYCQFAGVSEKKQASGVLALSPLPAIAPTPGPVLPIASKGQGNSGSFPMTIPGRQLCSVGQRQVAFSCQARPKAFLALPLRTPNEIAEVHALELWILVR
jgi:hypothetical protein